MHLWGLLQKGPPHLLWEMLCSRNPRSSAWLILIPDWCRALCLPVWSSKIDTTKNMTTTCRADPHVCDTRNLCRGKFSALHAEPIRSLHQLQWQAMTSKDTDRCDSSTFGLVSSHGWHVSASGLTAEWINGQMCVCASENDSHTETEWEDTGDSYVNWIFGKASYLRLW